MVISVAEMTGQSRPTVIADSVTHEVLSSASVFGKDGQFLGITRADGKIPYAAPQDYPITIRYMGFTEKTVTRADADTVFLQENFMELPEVVVESRQTKVLHILAYEREYSTLSTYTDTVSMFREKMIDFILPDGERTSFKGWRYPRILKSRSYYRFTDNHGLDSVSDRYNQHFTWSDWIGAFPPARIPSSLAEVEEGNDTLRGKYSPTEIWVRNGSRLTLDIDVLADTASRRWVPNLASFFRKDNIDFERFRLRLQYGNVAGNMIGPLDLTRYSFNIESRGRGRGMFRFNHIDQPFFVTTYTEVYILDKEYITVKEAKKWEKLKLGTGEIAIYEPQEAPPLQPSTLALIDRVNAIDSEQVRLTLDPDENLISRNVKKGNFSIGHRALAMLKQLTGITAYKANKKAKKQWKEFRKKQVKQNNIVRDSVAEPTVEDNLPESNPAAR